MTPRLHIIIASTRPGRLGAAVGEWFVGQARAHGAFDVAVVDLKAMALPIYDEPHHPRLRTYEHEHTRRWSQSVGAADAFVFVTPEYNYGPSPALLNALNYVYVEWNYKPAAFVSYGGISGGIRAVQMTKLILTTLKMVPVLEQVTIPMIGEKVRDGVFQAADVHVQAAGGLLNELQRWTEALTPMRRGD